MAAKRQKLSGGAIEALQASAVVEAPQSEAIVGQFVGQWHRLVSTTNWEKGRIICQWREALELAAAPVTAYSDDAWAQLVGSVTSQHVGRLRRVFQRFGGVFNQYEGLYWSHFQAALDWADAEMWLEGAILNNWSVSQMRGRRWETLGNAGDPPAEDAVALENDDQLAEAPSTVAVVQSFATEAAESAPWESADESNDEAAGKSPATRDESSEEPVATPVPKARKRLAVDVDDLPADLADAFEQFKLAIIAHRRTGWGDASPAMVIECLDALRELALAPADD